jgi:riboflavin biosynthesis pyrimidine reductase
MPSMERLGPGETVDDPLDLYRRVERVPRPGGPGCWAMANMVAGLDGCAAIGGRVGALSGEVDRALFLAMRSLADIVLVGASTVREEGYGPVRLTEGQRAERRLAGRDEVPPIAVVSRSLQLDLARPLFQDPVAGVRPVVVTCESSDPARRAEIAAVADVVVAGDDAVDLRAALGALDRGRAGVVLCEGGPRLLGELVAADLLDELCLSLSPIMGGDPLPVAVVPPGPTPSTFVLRHVAEADGSLFLRYERGGGA